MFDLLLTRPLFNALILIYDFSPVANLGVAIVAITILIKLALWPLTGASMKSQKAMQAIQPKINEVKRQFKDDKAGQP